MSLLRLKLENVEGEIDEIEAVCHLHVVFAIQCRHLVGWGKVGA